MKQPEEYLKEVKSWKTLPTTLKLDILNCINEAQIDANNEVLRNIELEAKYVSNNEIHISQSSFKKLIKG